MDVRFSSGASMADYCAEVEKVRLEVDSRYDDIKCSRVKPVDGPAFFHALREREEELLKNRSPR